MSTGPIALVVAKFFDSFCRFVLGRYGDLKVIPVDQRYPAGLRRSRRTREAGRRCLVKTRDPVMDRGEL